ncbi:MAG: hypothetical protein L3J73_05330, partial [Thermoplasmata archaeon]|nr:hypothetical protein [Thermoplasmata archaeon]
MRPPRSPRDPLQTAGRISFVLAVLALLLFSTPGLSAANGRSAVPPAPIARSAAPSLIAHVSAPEPSLAAAPTPAVTAVFDWDTQPFTTPPSFPLVDIAGEGAM